MSQFVMVINQITSEQFNKLISIQVKSQDKIKFVPQASQQFAVNTSAFVSSIQNAIKDGKNTPEQIYSNIRLEWTDEAAHFAREVFDMFIKTDLEQVQKAG
jgi:hypothetical protein